MLDKIYNYMLLLICTEMYILKAETPAIKSGIIKEETPAFKSGTIKEETPAFKSGMIKDLAKKKLSLF